MTGLESLDFFGLDSLKMLQNGLTFTLLKSFFLPWMSRFNFFFDFRHFKLYLTTNTGLFTDNFKAVFVDKHGREENYDVQLQNYFTGHVVGK